MKVGTSLGKCIKDILDEKVRYDDVFVIVTNTRTTSLDQLLNVIEQYYYEKYRPEYDLSNYTLDQCFGVAKQLFNDGKLHQPRAVGALHANMAHTLKDTWYDIVPSPMVDNETVKEAWNHYVMLSKLVRLGQ
jgi:hypothetical protein